MKLKELQNSRRKKQTSYMDKKIRTNFIEETDRNIVEYSCSEISFTRTRKNNMAGIIQVWLVMSILVRKMC